MTRWRKWPALFVFGALSLAVYVACGGDETSATPETGGLGQACSTGDTCNPGLDCKAGVCVAKADATPPVQDAGSDAPVPDSGCASVEDDARNCGRCGHICPGGGSCLRGTCSATPFVNLITTPTAIATDGTNVYWAERGAPATSTSGSVRRCPIAGCNGQPTVVASGLPLVRALAATATQVWITTEDATQSVLRCPAAGCGADAGAVETAATDQNLGLALAAGGDRVLYPIERSATTDAGALRVCNAGSCPPASDYATGFDTPKDVILTTPSAFIVAKNAIHACNAGSCDPGATLFQATTSPVLRAAAVDQDLVWIDANGDVSSCPQAGCAGTGPKKVLVRNKKQNQSAFFVGGIDGVLYIAENDEPTGPRWLRSCQPAQCAATIKNRVSLLAATPRFVIANKLVFFTADNAIMRWEP